MLEEELSSAQAGTGGRGQFYSLPVCIDARHADLISAGRTDNTSTGTLAFAVDRSYSSGVSSCCLSAISFTM